MQAEETPIERLLRTSRRALEALEVAVEMGGGDPKEHEACCELREALAHYKKPLEQGGGHHDR